MRSFCLLLYPIPPQNWDLSQMIFGWKFPKSAIVRCLRGSGLFLSWSRAPRCLSAAAAPTEGRHRRRRAVVPCAAVLVSRPWAAHGSCPQHHSLSEGRQPYSEILVPVPCTALWPCFWKFSSKKYLKKILILVTNGGFICTSPSWLSVTSSIFQCSWTRILSVQMSFH